MEPNPVYELCRPPSNILSDDKKGNALPPDSEAVTRPSVIVNDARKRKISGRVFVAGSFATVAVLALLILVGAVLSIAMQRTNASVSVTGESNAELKSIVGSFAENLTLHLNSQINDLKNFYEMIEINRSTLDNTITQNLITCPSLVAPDNGGVTLTPGADNSNIGLGSVVVYSCELGYVLSGEGRRECVTDTENYNGTWTGTAPQCQVDALEGTLVNCENTVCRYEQLVCPDQDNCTVHCNDSRPYACFRTELICPSVQGDCILNCDDSYACLQANTTCPQGNCDILCPADSSCRNSSTQCSGDNCLLACGGEEACSYSTVECLGESCSTYCQEEQSCSYSTMDCLHGNCSLYCTDRYACQYSTVRCSAGASCDVNCQYGDQACFIADFVCEQGSNCVFIFDGGDSIGWNSDITCEENSTCSIRCTGLSNSARYQCNDANIICPSSSGYCTVECSGYQSCQISRITCGPNNDCLTCSGEHSCRIATVILQTNELPALNCTGLSSCQFANFHCPTDSNCTINCDGQYSCTSAHVTCPTGDYDCIIRCTDPLSCQGLRITNTHKVSLLCCSGPTACGGTVTPTSTHCPYIN